MEQKYKMSFHKGVNEDVINDGKNFVKIYGKDRLNEVCKLHFKTLNEIID